LTNKPVITLSIPTINRRIEAVNTNKTTVRAGFAMMVIDSITAIAPKPICAIRNQLGDFTVSLSTEESIVFIISLLVAR
jgi:hypothetical protein